jgi:hypothetical protein
MGAVSAAARRRLKRARGDSRDMLMQPWHALYFQCNGARVLHIRTQQLSEAPSYVIIRYATHATALQSLRHYIRLDPTVPVTFIKHSSLHRTSIAARLSG